MQQIKCAGQHCLHTSTTSNCSGSSSKLQRQLQVLLLSW